MDQEELDKMVAEMPHVPGADWSGEIAIATLAVLTRRFGKDFAREVRAEIIKQADFSASSEDPDQRADAPHVRAIADAPWWPADEADDEIANP